MALVTTKEMFKKAYEGGYAIGAFNINNMEIIQAEINEARRIAYHARKTLATNHNEAKVKAALGWN